MADLSSNFQFQFSFKYSLMIHLAELSSWVTERDR